MATQNNVRIPEDLFNQAQGLAASQGRTADDLAADALRRYIEVQQNVRALDELGACPRIPQVGRYEWNKTGT